MNAILFAAMLIGQQPLPPQAPVIPQAPPIQKISYPENPEKSKPAFASWAIASQSVTFGALKQAKTPIAVFIGAPARLVPGVLPCQEASGFVGIRRGIIVAVPKAGGFRQVDLPADASDEDIIAATKEVRPAASPFSFLQFLRQRRAERSNVDVSKPVSAGPWGEGIEKAANLVRYRPARFTQRIAVTNDRDSIDPVPIEETPSKWHQPGGLEGVTGWRSDLYKAVPEGGQEWVGDIAVWNGSNFQNNRGHKRAYPPGTEFHDVLTNDAGEVFAHRIAHKTAEGWERFTAYRNDKAAPAGYVHVKVNRCTSCHNDQDGPGTGGYAAGLAPGFDTIVSDPLRGLE